MTRNQIISRFCDLQTRVWEKIDPNANTACDCLCEDSPHHQNEGLAMNFIENAVKKALNELDD